jgi:hypothetical protein
MREKSEMVFKELYAKRPFAGARASPISETSTRTGGSRSPVRLPRSRARDGGIASQCLRAALVLFLITRRPSPRALPSRLVPGDLLALT